MSKSDLKIRIEVIKEDIQSIRDSISEVKQNLNKFITVKTKKGKKIEYTKDPDNPLMAVYQDQIKELEDLLDQKQIKLEDLKKQLEIIGRQDNEGI